MPPKIETWTSEKENILIFEVERRPMLWDASCETYKRTDLKYNQWYQIAEILGPPFNADMIQHRFTSMKQTFMTNFRKERESKKRCSGKSPEEIYKPKWVLYDRLKFLIKSCVQAESLSNLQTSLNISYSKAKSVTDNIVTKNITESSENIEYLEDTVADIPQLYLRHIQKQYIPTDAPENEIYSSLEDLSSCSNNNLSNSLSLPHHDSELSSPSGSSTVEKLPATVHSSATLKSTSSKHLHNKENMYMKRGSAKKRKESLVEKAIGAIETLTNQPKSENDSAEFFGVFIAARLREMSPLSRKQCEHEIIKCLANY